MVSSPSESTGSGDLATVLSKGTGRTEQAGTMVDRAEDLLYGLYLHGDYAGYSNLEQMGWSQIFGALTLYVEHAEDYLFSLEKSVSTASQQCGITLPKSIYSGGKKCAG